IAAERRLPGGARVTRHAGSAGLWEQRHAADLARCAGRAASIEATVDFAGRAAATAGSAGPAGPAPPPRAPPGAAAPGAPPPRRAPGPRPPPGPPGPRAAAGPPRPPAATAARAAGETQSDDTQK